MKVKEIKKSTVLCELRPSDNHLRGVEYRKYVCLSEILGMPCFFTSKETCFFSFTPTIRQTRIADTVLNYSRKSAVRIEEGLIIQALLKSHFLMSTEVLDYGEQVLQYSESVLCPRNEYLPSPITIPVTQF